MPYGIRDEVWNKLPPDDRAAIAATAAGRPPPAIGGYAPQAATSAPPPNLSAGTGSRTPPTGDYPVATPVMTPTRATIGPPLLDGRTLASWTLASREAQVGRVRGGRVLADPDEDALATSASVSADAAASTANPLRPFVVRRGPARGTSITAADIRVVARLRRVTVRGVRIANPLLTVEAAKHVGLPLTLALALLSQESSGGRNVWGHDPGKNFWGGTDLRTGKDWGDVVNRSAYAAYKAQRATGGEQGVGPTQLTSASLQDRADKLGGTWKPLPNLVVGLGDVQVLIRKAGGSVAGGLSAYNRNPTYPSVILGWEREWAAALGLKSVQP